MKSPDPPKPRELLAIEDVAGREPRVTIVRVLIAHLHDSDIIQTIGAQMYSLVEDNKRHHLIVNLSAVQSTLTEFLGKLVGLLKRINAAKGKLALCGISPKTNSIVHEAFDVCGFMNLFRIYADEKDALERHF